MKNINALPEAAVVESTPKAEAVNFEAVLTAREIPMCAVPSDAEKARREGEARAHRENQAALAAAEEAVAKERADKVTEIHDILKDWVANFSAKVLEQSAKHGHQQGKKGTLVLRIFDDITMPATFTKDVHYPHKGTAGFNPAVVTAPGITLDEITRMSEYTTLREIVDAFNDEQITHQALEVVNMVNGRIEGARHGTIFDKIGAAWNELCTRFAYATFHKDTIEQYVPHEATLEAKGGVLHLNLTISFGEIETKIPLSRAKGA